MSEEYKPTEIGVIVTPQEQQALALEAWMREVTDLLVYQPDVPLDHKQSLVNAFAEYRRAIGKPLRE